MPATPRAGAIAGATASKKVVIPDSNGNPRDAITGASVAVVLYAVEIDCTANTGEDVFTRFYDANSAAVGTDDAELLCKGIAGKVETYLFEKGIPFATSISVATVTNAGGTGGATSPSGTVKVTFEYA